MRNIIFLTLSFFAINSFLLAAQEPASPARSNNPYGLMYNSVHIYRTLIDLESEVSRAVPLAVQAIEQSQEDRRNMAILHQRVDESYNFIRFYMDQTVLPFLDRLPNDLFRHAQKKLEEHSKNNKDNFALLRNEFETFKETVSVLLQQQAEDQKKIQTLQRQLKESEKRNEEQDKKYVQLQKMHSQIMERVSKLEQKEQEKNQMFQRTLKKLDSYSEKIQEEMALRKDLIQKISTSDKLKRDVEKIASDLKKLQSKVESQNGMHETILRMEKHVNNLESLYEKKHPHQLSIVDTSTSTDGQEITPIAEVEEHLEEVAAISLLAPIPDEKPKITAEAEKKSESAYSLIIPEDSKADDHDKQEIFGIIQKVMGEYFPGKLSKLEVIDFTKDASKNHFLQNVMAHPVVAKMNTESAISEDEYKIFQVLLKRQFIEYTTAFMMKESIDHTKYLEVIEYLCKLDSCANQFCFITHCMEFYLKNKDPIKENVHGVLKKTLEERIQFIKSIPYGKLKTKYILSQLIMIEENIPLITSFIKKFDHIQDAIFFVDYFKQILDSYAGIKNMSGIQNFQVGVDVVLQRSQLKYFILKYIQEAAELIYNTGNCHSEEYERSKKKIDVLQKTFDLLNDTHCKECIHTIIPQKGTLSDTDILCLKTVLMSLNIVYVAMPEKFFECMIPIFKSLNTTYENLLRFYNIIADMNKQKKQFKGFNKEVMALIKNRSIPDPDLK